MFGLVGAGSNCRALTVTVTNLRHPGWLCRSRILILLVGAQAPQCDGVKRAEAGVGECWNVSANSIDLLGVLLIPLVAEVVFRMFWVYLSNVYFSKRKLDGRCM